MLKNTIIICALVAATAFAGDHCADFVVVNIATNDTTLHFTQKGTGKGEITNGDCHYETDWFGSGVQWRRCGIPAESMAPVFRPGDWAPCRIYQQLHASGEIKHGIYRRNAR